MSGKNVKERPDTLLRKAYESGELSAEEFIEKLFSSREADRIRQDIVKENKESYRGLQEA